VTLRFLWRSNSIEGYRVTADNSAAAVDGDEPMDGVVQFALPKQRLHKDFILDVR